MIQHKNISTDQIASAVKQANAVIKEDQKAWAKNQAAEREIQSALKTPPPEARSILSYKDEAPDPGKTLLGERWLCVGGSALVIGPTGIGKSSSSMQQDICWSIGREAFGIKPTRPLRILVIQAENDNGDLHEMTTGVMRGMGLTEDEEKLCGENLIIAFEQERSGKGFIHGVLHPLLEKHRPDIFRIDPLKAYAGCDMTNDAEIAKLLRHEVNPLLNKFNCAAIIVNHTPKNNNRDTSKYRASDWAYAGAGGADIVNWARAMLAIDPCKEDGKFCFIAAKRGGRIGWRDSSGRKAIKKWFKHAAGSICWEDADEPAASGAKHTEDSLYDLMPLGVSMSKKDFIHTANLAGFPKSTAERLLSKLISNGRLIQDKLPRSGTNAQNIIRRPDTVPLPNAIPGVAPTNKPMLMQPTGIVVSFPHGDDEDESSGIMLTEVKSV